jgi:hypothetical protein
MAKKAKISNALEELLKEKAHCSPCTYRISAIAFDKKGNILGHTTNSHSLNWNVLEKAECGRAGTALHAEKRLIAQYSRLIKTIVICRVGRSGKIRPIDPCPSCKKTAAKYGINIVSLMPGNGHQYET